MAKNCGFVLTAINSYPCLKTTGAWPKIHTHRVVYWFIMYSTYTPDVKRGHALGVYYKHNITCTYEHPIFNYLLATLMVSLKTNTVKHRILDHLIRDHLRTGPASKFRHSTP